MHWTYEGVASATHLEQGDLIAPTPELRGVLEAVHPHFCSPKYLCFTVATQSCDLVQRGAGSKARYITIAAVRSLKEVLPRLLDQVAKPIAPGMFPNSTKAEARQFLARLFDQNEQGLGLFYLHPDAEIGLGEPAVAFLRVTVALRSQHYDTLVQARTGRLKPEFRGKFGWLLGNLYSRVAAPDWSDAEGGGKAVKNLIDKHVKEQIPGVGPTWIDDDLLDAGKAAGVAFDGRNHADILAELEAYRPKPLPDRLADVVVSEAARVFACNERDLDELRRDLLETASNEMSALVDVEGFPSEDVRHVLQRVVEAAVQRARRANADHQRLLRNKLLNSASFRKLLR